MRFIKYTSKHDPNYWFIRYLHTEGEKTQKCVKTSGYGIVIHKNWIDEFNPEKDSLFYHIEYLTEEEADMLMLEIL